MGDHSVRLAAPTCVCCDLTDLAQMPTPLTLWLGCAPVLKISTSLMTEFPVSPTAPRKLSVLFDVLLLFVSVRACVCMSISQSACLFKTEPYSHSNL